MGLFSKSQSNVPSIALSDLKALFELTGQPSIETLTAQAAGIIENTEKRQAQVNIEARTKEDDANKTRAGKIADANQGHKKSMEVVIYLDSESANLAKTVRAGRELLSKLPKAATK